MALSEKDRDRMVKLLSMFSSNHDGEVTNAARAAFALLQRNKTDWDAVLRPAGAGQAYDAGTPHHQAWSSKPQQQPPPNRKADFAHKADVEACQERSELLSAWEKEFLESLLGRYSLSEKQAARLNAIKEKLAKYKDMTW